MTRSATRLLPTSAGLLTLAMLVGCPQPRSAFESTGTLVAGAECLLFEADGGGRFVLDDTQDFAAGDRVRVEGLLDEQCASTCQEGRGCVNANTIEEQDAGFSACGTLVQGTECVLFESDGGARFVIETQGSFRVGNRVRVSGTYVADCISICMEGVGCIQPNTIRACD